MSDATSCPRCNAPLPAGVAPENCPRCLLAAGLESVAPAAPGGAAPTAAAPAPPPTAPSPEEIGKHFPQLEVLELLGQGGMGIVYKARQKSLDRMVALKVMPPDVARDPGFADRFTREARTLARLQHANIVSIHDFGTSDGLYYLLMEYIDGANLRDAMRAGAISPSQALAIVPQVCDALQYAHENGVVHRDVKPENILLDRAGRVKIADFGLAKIVQRTPVDVTLTRAGQVMGTLHYMAPEQYRAPDAVDHRADIYSLGVVFYEMLTGELPLGSFPPPSEKAGCDLRVDRVILRALESERERRWQSASDVKTRMTEIAAGPDAPASPAAKPAAPAAPLPPPPARASVLATVGALGVPAAIVLGLVTAFAWPGSSSADAAAIVTGAVLLAGWIVSLVAWVRIHHAGGVVRGNGWALTGTLLPLPFLCCGVPMLLSAATIGSPWGINVTDGPDGTHVSMPGIDVKEGPDGTRVRMPGIDVKDGPDGTRVTLPGISITEKDGVSHVRVSGPAVTAEDEAEKAHVTGGSAALTDDDRAALVATMRMLWETAGRRGLREMRSTLGGANVKAKDLRFFHLALEGDGSTGRLVLTDGGVTFIVGVVKDPEGWRLETSVREFQGERGANDDDRDGHLGR